jgi:N6-adenosine-specific RNA methylase IME4
MTRKQKITTCFAEGKNKQESREMCEPFTTGIIDPDWPYTPAPVGKDSEVGEKDAPQCGYTRYRDSKKNVCKEDAITPLSIEQLGNLPIGDLIGGYLFMWTVSPFLIGTGVKPKPLEVEGKSYPSAALYLLERWGFVPCSMITWGKYNLSRLDNGETSGGYGGVGFWFLGNAEFVIVAKKPNMPSIRTGESSLFLDIKGKHSVKPKTIHQVVEQRFPGPYVEIFGRYGKNEIGVDATGRKKIWDFGKAPKGWTVIGNQSVGIGEPGYGQDVFSSVEKHIQLGAG